MFRLRSIALKVLQPYAKKNLRPEALHLGSEKMLYSTKITDYVGKLNEKDPNAAVFFEVC